MENLARENHAYWLKRAEGYSEVNREELSGIQHQTWPDFLEEEIGKQFPDRKPENLQVLDIGAGPGFLSIVLTERGYQVTAADFAESMLEEARRNAGTLADRIHFCREDAMELSFADESFDIVLSRNLTWNLPDPKKAYGEWLRVLKRGGLLLNFDANWYRYLVDDRAREAYEEDRKKVAERKVGDYNIGENFDRMEEIADQLPLTGKDRPAWDLTVLRELGAASVRAVENIGDRLYSEKEKLNYGATPLFMVEAIKY
jgi:ubiquinone/menaquinone biosynthesis C-methylase UbiE